MFRQRITQWLVVSATGRCRLRASRPEQRELERFEVAYRIDIELPANWAKVVDPGITVTLPTPQEPTIELLDELVVGAGRPGGEDSPGGEQKA